MDADRASLNRRLQPSAIVAALLFAAPGLAALVWGATRDTWWGWILATAGAAWTAIVVVAGWQAIWQPREEDSDAKRSDG
jgi:hypothetical protein